MCLLIRQTVPAAAAVHLHNNLSWFVAPQRQACACLATPHLWGQDTCDPALPGSHQQMLLILTASPV